jgi:plastocyanin domain-containing protein
MNRIATRIQAALAILGVVALGFAAIEGGRAAAAAASDAGKKEAKPRQIEISVTENGFEPNSSTVRKGEQVVVIFTRKTDSTCAKSVVVDAEGTEKIRKDLPLNTPVSISLTPKKAGTIKCACGMNMYSGVVRVE